MKYYFGTSVQNIPAVPLSLDVKTLLSHIFWYKALHVPGKSLVELKKRRRDHHQSTAKTKSNT